MNVFVRFDKFLSHKNIAIFNIDLGFGAMKAVFVGFDNFLSRKSTAVFNVDLGFLELKVTDLFTTTRSAFQIQVAAFYYNMHVTILIWDFFLDHVLFVEVLDPTSLLVQNFMLQ